MGAVILCINKLCLNIVVLICAETLRERSLVSFCDHFIHVFMFIAIFL